jgi:hypothetical protein
LRQNNPFSLRSRQPDNLCTFVSPPLDALSIAAIENLREDTLYSATGGGMGPGTIAALEALLGRIAMLPGALFCSATDANGAGDRFAQRHHALAKQFAVTFERLRPPVGGDWNDVLRAR